MPTVVGNNPPEAILSTNAGTGIAAQIAIVGDDSYGLITLNTGDNPNGNKICDVRFQENQSASGLIVEIVPVNAQAQPTHTIAAGIEPTGFELIASQELNDNDVYQWTYRVTKIITE